MEHHGFWTQRFEFKSKQEHDLFYNQTPVDYVRFSESKVMQPFENVGLFLQPKLLWGTIVGGNK